MLGPCTQPKILDFGVAHITDSDVQQTTLRSDSSEILGTVAYMSPEQIRGDLDAIDARTDVYALGVVLYELLTDQLPYDVRSKPIPEAMRILDETDPARPSVVNQSLSGGGPWNARDLDTIVATAMAEEPPKWYASPFHMADDINPLPLR